MRLFIALNFDAETVKRIVAVQSRLRRVADGNFSRQENMHLTLAFLGEVPPEREEEVCRAMDETGMALLNLCFDGAGAFRRTGGDIWWLGLREDPELMNLQRSLAKNLRAAGFSLEERGFTPHLTLSRETAMRTKPDVEALLGGEFTAEVGAMSLMLSERVNGRLRYSERYRLETEGL